MTPQSTEHLPRSHKRQPAKAATPEIEVKVSPAWINLIQFCQSNLTHGRLSVEINNGEPGELDWEHTKIKIRFDRGSVPQGSVFPTGSIGS
jgi:hypothetical protein